MVKTALLLFPHQLFRDHALIEKHSTIVFIEDAHFFHDFSFHKQKIMFYRSTMQAYAALLKKHGKHVIYYEQDECKSGLKKVFSLLKKEGIEQADYFDVIDKALAKKIVDAADKADFLVTVHDSPSFFLSSQEAALYFKKKKRYSMASFYQYMRKKYDVFMYRGKPVGGKWSFDTENRKMFDDQVRFAKTPESNECSHVRQARAYVKKHFQNNPGDVDCFIYPVTHEQAQDWFKDFLHHKLRYFGTYQDAMDIDHPFGFHSLLSPLINVGLLMPQEVIAQAIDYAGKHKIPMNEIEGFVRQVLGWREFVRAVYVVSADTQRKKNVFHHKKNLKKTFWTATTGIDPIDSVIKSVLKYAYAHHIERLMVLGNFMLLSEIDPNDVYKWFMEMFIDAYDWVMVPNVYGMSQYADGGVMVTKPYCSGSSYIKKMSNYKSGIWIEIWDALYWHFIYKNKKMFSSNARMGLVIGLLKKMSSEKLKKHMKIASTYLK